MILTKIIMQGHCFNFIISYIDSISNNFIFGYGWYWRIIYNDCFDLI